MSLEARIKAKVWRRVALMPWVVGPWVTAGVVYAYNYAMMIHGGPLDAVSGFVVGAAVLGLVNLGRYHSRHGPRLAAEEMDKMRRGLMSRRQGSLPELRAALELNHEKAAIADVDLLLKHIDRLDRGLRGEGFTVPDDLNPTLLAMRKSCEDTLRQAVRLGGVARDLSTQEAQDEVRALRVDLLTEVHHAVHQLGVALDRLQIHAVRRDPSDAELNRLRSELDAQLDVARRVEERLSDLDQRLRVR